MNKDLEKELTNLVKLLRRKATIEAKRIGNDSSHYEGMCKGMYIGYEEAASRLAKIIK